MNIRTKLVLTLVGVALGAALAVGFFASMNAGRALLDARRTSLEALAVGRVDRVNVIMRQWMDRLDDVGRDRLLVQSLSDLQSTGYSRFRKRISRILAQQIEGTGELIWLEVADANGAPVVSSGSLEDFAPPTSFADRTPSTPGLVSVFPVAESPPVALVDVPVRLNRSVIGYLRGAFVATALETFANNRGDLGESGVALISRLANAGRVDLVVETEGAGHRGAARLDQPDAMIVRPFLADAKLAASIHDRSVLTASRAIPGTDLGLLVRLDEAEALEPVRAFQRGLYLFGALVAAVGVLAGTLLARSLSTPIQHLASVVRDIREGGLNRRATVAGQDEIATLARSFNEMADELVAANRDLESRVLARTAELDATNRELERRAVELTRSNAELEQFASVASHDLQEPLRKVQAFGGRLIRGYGPEMDDRSRDYLQRMVNSAERMQMLVQDLLSLARVRSRARPFESVDLGDVVADVLEELDLLVTERGATVTVAKLPTISADPTQMAQLFRNLIANALKYVRPDVAPVIHVGAEIWDERATIRVQDNGIGFEPQYSEKIFRIFQRLHGRDEYVGTGIGLAICQRIVERHDGLISADSTPGEGATFIVDLPLRQPQQVAKEEELA